MCHHKNNELGREIGDEYHAFLIVIMKTLLYIDGKEKIGQGYHKLIVTIVSIHHDITHPCYTIILCYIQQTGDTRLVVMVD